MKTPYSSSPSSSSPSSSSPLSVPCRLPVAPLPSLLVRNRPAAGAGVGAGVSLGAGVALGAGVVLGTGVGDGAGSGEGVSGHSARRTSGRCPSEPGDAPPELISDGM